MRSLYVKSAVQAGAIAISLLTAEAIVRWIETSMLASKVECFTFYNPLLVWRKQLNRSVEDRVSQFHLIENTNSRGLRPALRCCETPSSKATP